MGRRMKVAYLNKGLLHVETPNAVVNIRVGLHDRLGRSVDSIEILPDDYAGEEKVVVYPGKCNTRIVRLKTVKNRGG